MPHIVGTGLLALDLIVQHGAEGQRLSASGGGTCGNVLAILARLGWNASWLGSIESSPPGHMVLAEMEGAGVCMHTVPESEASPVPVFAHHIHVDEHGHADHWFSDACPHCARKLPRYERPSDTWLRNQDRHVHGADVFFVDRLSAGALDLAELARSRGALVVYEPSVASDAPWMTDMISLADVVKFSSDRSSALSGIAPPNDRALWVETRGREGLRWSLGRVGARGEVTPAIQNPTAVDACGAGDWFTSALLFGLARSNRKPVDLTYSELAQLMRLASGVAAWSCSFLGARGGLYDAPVRTIFEQLRLSPTHSAPAGTLMRPTPRADAGEQCVYA